MGIAAYNRGVAATVRSIREDYGTAYKTDRHNAAVIRMLNAAPRGERTPLCPTVARPLNGRWCLMDNREDGWSAYAYEYPSLLALFAAWNVYVTGVGQDKASFYYAVSPGRPS